MCIQGTHQEELQSNYGGNLRKESGDLAGRVLGGIFREFHREEAQGNRVSFRERSSLCAGLTGAVKVLHS